MRLVPLMMGRIMMVFGLLVLCISCTRQQRSHKGQVVVVDTPLPAHRADSAAVLEQELTGRLKNKVVLDSLLTRITRQEQVKVLAELKKEWVDDEGCYQYSNDRYNFKLRIVKDDSSDADQTNSIFIDGRHEISFKDYAITCFDDALFHCEDYGFNWDNSLEHPKIIQVCGRKFLYADVMHGCNGRGCACVITFIYDLQTHKPIFLENFSVPFDKFFISDFDLDHVPDILVIVQSSGHRMKGYDLDEYEIKLVAYSIKDGRLSVKWDGKFNRPYCYELYTVTESGVEDRTARTFSITKDHWLKQ